jgi:hypothetical protein
VEVFLSRFAGDGAYAIYTNRLTGEIDPTDEHAARKLPEVTSLPAASGAMGTGKAYAERGSYFLELTYTNDQETPDQLKKSSDVILTALAKAIANTLPETPDVPASAKALPQADLVPNGVMYFDKDVLGIPNAGAGAVGYFKSAKPKRYRMVSAVREGVDSAKDLIHLLRGQAGALPVANLGDDAVEVVLQASPERAKIDWIIARKGPNVMGVGDEEFASEDASLRLTKDEKIAKLRAELK